MASNGQSIDFIYFQAGASFTDFMGSVTFSLYNGATLLGSATTTEHTADRRFAPANSDWIDAGTTVIDFSSIAAGTIQGHFEFIPSFSNPTANSKIDLSYSIITGDAISPGMYFPGPSPSAISTSVVAVPEPSTLAFLNGTIGMAVILCRRRLTSRAPALVAKPRF